MYLERVLRDKEDEYENDEEDEEGCNAGESDENSPGRSLETHCMKNEPIGKGYKFFCLATKE
eukprot:11282579-Ditylum_brightwellii.AAC.1